MTCPVLRHALATLALAIGGTACARPATRGVAYPPAPTVERVGFASPTLARAHDDRRLRSASSGSPVGGARLPRSVDDAADRVLAMKCLDVLPRETGYDLSAGLAVGVVFSGRQDLKFKRYGANGVQSDYFFTDDVDTSTDHVETLDVTAWKRGGALDRFGARIEAARWSSRSKARSFQDRLGSSVAAPPFDSVDEERFGVFASLAHRWPLSRCVSCDDSPYFFVGAGLGEVHSKVTHGESLWDLGSQFYAGFALPVSPSWRLRVEGTFFVTHDVDVPGVPRDWVVDTSGAHLWSHSTWDTRYYAVTVGLEFRF